MTHPPPPARGTGYELSMAERLQIADELERQHILSADSKNRVVRLLLEEALERLGERR